MLKKLITYTNFNDEKVSEVHTFHISKADLIEMNVSKKGGFAAWFEAMTASDDQAQIYAEIKKLVIMAYGVVSDDGKRFIRNDDIRASFTETEAFSEIMTELCTNETAAAEFIAGAIPHGLDEELAKQVAKQEATVARVLTRKDLVEMNSDEISSLIAQGATVEQTDI